MLVLLFFGDILKISESFVIIYKEGGNVVDFVFKLKIKDIFFDILCLLFCSGKVNDMQMIDGVGQCINILFFDVKMNEVLDVK